MLRCAAQCSFVLRVTFRVRVRLRVGLRRSDPVGRVEHTRGGAAGERWKGRRVLLVLRRGQWIARQEAGHLRRTQTPLDATRSSLFLCLCLCHALISA